jgi:putative PIN family toxin of toxin-antitoxin system
VPRLRPLTRRPARAIFDANLLISAVIAGKKLPPGTTCRVVDQAFDGPARVIVCPHLLDEIENALRRPRMRPYVSLEEVSAVMTWILGATRHVDDPKPIARTVPADPNDDYIVALAGDNRATIATGDSDFDPLRLSPTSPVRVIGPAEFLALPASTSARRRDD